MFHSRLKNVTLTEMADIEVVQILEQYFPNDIASIGAIIRKISLLLLDLSAVTRSSWMVICHEDANKQLVTSFYQITKYGDVLNFFFVHSLRRMASYHSLQHILRQMFQKDKWTDVASDFVVVDLVRKDGKYRYIKSRNFSKMLSKVDNNVFLNIDMDATLFVVLMQFQKLTYLERLFQFFKPKSNIPRSGVVEYSVLEV